MQSFGAVLALVWTGGCIASFYLAQHQNIPAGIAAFTAFALLLEISFYLATSQAELLRSRGGRAAAPLLWFSSLLPYLIYSTAAGTFSWLALGTLGSLSAAACWWYRLVPSGGITDLVFLAYMAAVYLAKPFVAIYPPVAEDVRVDVLGQLMWIRIGILSVLWFRGAAGVGFGFLPTRQEWLTGLRFFLYLLPPALAVVLLTRFAEFRVAEGWWWKAPLTFAGIFLVVALAEEFFFRGILQQRLTQWGGPAVGLAGASVLFGLAHLWFRQFPNWNMVAVAAVVGVFCGLAFQRAGSIRAPMVTHALVVTVWRSFLA
jgi:membrane protease YdiL (CAAX protease family)